MNPQTGWVPTQLGDIMLCEDTHGLQCNFFLCHNVNTVCILLFLLQEPSTKRSKLLTRVTSLASLLPPVKTTPLKRIGQTLQVNYSPSLLPVQCVRFCCALTFSCHWNGDLHGAIVVDFMQQQLKICFLNTVIFNFNLLAEPFGVVATSPQKRRKTSSSHFATLC